MRVIAIDPGYDRLGVAVMELQDKETVLYSTCIETSRSATIPERLHEAGVVIESIVDTYQPDTMAVESLFFNKNVKTAIAVAQARGMLLYIGQRTGCMVYEFSPQEIKVATTGHGASKKAAVMDMIKKLVQNVPERAIDDEYDAIAIGVTCLAHYGRTR